MLALLLGLADGDAFERIDAVHAVLAWRSRKQQVTEGAAALYIAALKVGPVGFELSQAHSRFQLLREPAF